jgi:lipoate-protein ligase A
MSTVWRIIDTGSMNAAYNMALDEAISRSVLNGSVPPTLRLYGWSVPSVSLGYFQSIREIDVPYCKGNSIPIVRRPTGGRAILHGREVTYSFSAKNEGPSFSDGLLSTYGSLSRAFHRALSSLGIDVSVKTRQARARDLTKSALCFQSVSYGELSVGDKKVMGSAQKRWREGFLQQGSIQLRIDSEEMERVFRKADRQHILSSMTGLENIISSLSRDALAASIREAFEEVFQVQLITSDLSEEEGELALHLQREKYLSEEWTFRR